MAHVPPTPEMLIAHGDFLRGLARGLLGDDHRAEDLVQQTYVRAIATSPGHAGLRAWLATVARRLALNDRRTETRRIGREKAAARPSDVPSTAEIVEREAARRQVLDAVLRLPEPYRSTVLLRYFESLSPTEIGRRLEVPATTVRSRLQRAHEILRSELDRINRAWAVLLAPWTRPIPPLSAFAWSTLLMKKLVLGAAAAAVLVVGWLAVNSFGAPPAPDPSGGVTPIASAEPTADAPDATEVARQPLPTAARDAAGSDAEMSPSYRVALAGFRGRVIDSAGAPVAGCGVELFRLAFDAVLQGSAPRRAAPDLSAGQATTDPDGGFEITGVRPRGLFLLRAGIDTEDPTTRVLQYAPRPGEVVDLGDVTLADLAALTGTVQDAQGEPLPGAEVLAIDLPPPFLTLAPIYAFDPRGAVLLREGQGPTRVVTLPGWVESVIGSLPIPRTHTDADGRFSLAGVPPGRTALAVVAGDHQPLLQPAVEVPAGGRDLGALQLTNGERLGGLVLDARGEPLSGVEVLAAPNNPVAPADFAGAPMRTDANGRFTARGFPAGRVTLAARRSPAHRWITTEPTAIAEDLEIRMPTTGTVSVRLTSNDGLPIAAPRAALLAGHGPGLPELEALGFTTAVEPGPHIERSASRLQVRDLEPGWYTLRVADPAHADAMLPFELGSSPLELELRLDARVALTLRTVDVTGAPVAGASVFANPTPNPAWPAAMPMPAGVTDASGTVSLDHIPGDTVAVVASHPGFGQAVGLATRDGTPDTITFLETGTIEGVLHAAGRAPEQGAWSVLLTTPAIGGLPSFPPVVRPDAEGRFRFPNLQPGQYLLQAVAALDMTLTPAAVVELGRYAWMPNPRTVDVEVRGGRTEQVRLEVADPLAGDEPGARLTGTVMIDGRPGRGMFVVAQFDQGRDPEVTTVSADGRFDLGHVSAGRRYISTFDTEQRSFADNQPHMMWSGWVDVSDGADQELVIDVQTGSLAGEVLDATGQPAAEMWVEARGELSTPGPDEDEPLRSRYVVQTDSEGRFEITGVAPGTWQVSSRPYGAREAHGLQEGIVVEPGQRRGDVRIRMDR